MRLLLPLLALSVIWAEPPHAHGLGEAEARYQQGDFVLGRAAKGRPEGRPTAAAKLGFD
jgi:hypothetical protein